MFIYIYEMQYIYILYRSALAGHEDEIFGCVWQRADLDALVGTRLDVEGEQALAQL